MKFSLARPALAVAVSLALASCGGGSGKETYPVKVTVYNVLYDGLVLSTNGMDLAVPRQASAETQKVLNFPNGLDYGAFYEVVPKGAVIPHETGVPNPLGAQPAHQTCSPVGNAPRWYGTAGQTASVNDARTPAIEIFYSCTVNVLELSGTVSGLTSGTLTVTNGSNGATTIAANATTFSLPSVPFGSSYGVTIVPPQPAGLNCVVINGVGEMNQAAETAGGAKNVQIVCNPA